MTGWGPDGAAARVAAARRRCARVGPLVLDVVVVVAVLGFLVLAIGPRTGQYRTLTMLTGSMAPQYPTGSVVVVTPEAADSVEPGQVVVFQAPTADRHVVTHRVVSVDRSGPRPVLTTKGDANLAADPWQSVLQDDVVWRARLAVPRAGQAIAALRTPAASLALTLALPLNLLAWLLLAVWRPEGA